jgi:pyrroloquinoline quinone biosynthesis protein B
LIIRVLGSAAGGGVPQWNCRCANCESARAGNIPARMQASIAVSVDGSEWLLVNATTDVRRQLEELPPPPISALRSTPVSAVLLTDANIDHAAGLLELRQAQSLQIFSSAVVRDTLVGGNSTFGLLAQNGRTWSVFEADEKLADLPVVIPGLRVMAIDVPGLLPKYAGSSELPGAATAFMFEERIARRLFTRLLYAPIFLRASQALLAATDECEALFLDGSFWTDDELVSLGLGTRSAREMGHAPMSGDDGWLQAMAGRAAAADARRYCTHVNNSNPVLDPRSPAARALREASFSIAVDGMEIVLDGGG